MSQTHKMLFTTVASLCLLGCGGEELVDSSAPVAAVSTPTPSPTPSPTPTPTPATSSADGFVQAAKVKSGLNLDDWLVDHSIPVSAAPDVVGAFRFLCAPSHLAYDDPIVHKGKPGAAHLHQFFGNTKANAFSTYESLRTDGDSTCTNVLNRSAYWMPALLDGQGSVLVPRHVAIYYKRRPESDKWFTDNKLKAAVIPRGLSYVFGGDDMKPQFKCVDVWTPIAVSESMTTALAQCEPGQKFTVSLSAPDCWDGKNLQTTDNRSHVRHELRDGPRTYCPSSHPFVLATFTMTIEWSIEHGDTPNLWRFSSDMNGAAPGSTFHADWFGAWEDEVLDMWHDGCIDELLNCSDGDLGMGKLMRRNNLYPSDQYTRKVAVHSIPKG